MNFVDDVDAVLTARWREPSPRNQVARIIDTAIRSAVDLNDVEIFAAQNRVADFLTLRQCPVAIERACEDARHRRLANAAGSAEEIGVRGAPGCDGVLKRARDRLLPDDFTKVARAVTPSKHGVGLTPAS